MRQALAAPILVLRLGLNARAAGDRADEYIGFGLEALHYQSDITAQTANSSIGLTRFGRLDLHVTAFSADVLLRARYGAKRASPTERLPPYALIGPSPRSRGRTT